MPECSGSPAGIAIAVEADHAGLVPAKAKNLKLRHVTEICTAISHVNTANVPYNAILELQNLSCKRRVALLVNTL